MQCEGTSFVDSIKEDLRKSLCTKDILDLTGDIDESKIQILIMLVSAILKISPQLESISATLAAMFCKSMLTRGLSVVFLHFFAVVSGKTSHLTR